MSTEDLETDPNKRANSFVRRFANGGKILTIIGLIALIAGAGANIEKIWKWVETAVSSVDRREMPSNPRVIMVTPTTPEGHFGVLHKTGLNHGLSPTPVGSAHVIGGESTEFKLGSMNKQLKALEAELSKGDVLAVVAPSITEATPEVIDVVSKVEPSIPVFVESSIPWERLQTYRKAPPLFRLSSGIGERGREIGEMTDELVRAGFSVWLFVEEVPGERSYGVLMQDHVLRTNGGKLILPHQRVTFPTNDPEPHLKKLPLDDPRAVIFALCLGADFEKIVRSAYQVMSNRKARLIGVMNAHKLPSILDDGEFSSDLIFDISDLDIRPKTSRDRSAQTFYDSYASRWGKVLQTHRDQAFSYDVALLIHKAFSEDLSGRKYIDGLRQFAKNLANTSLIGVTGQIKFSNPRPDLKAAWQNNQPSFQVVSYISGEWSTVEWSRWTPNAREN